MWGGGGMYVPICVSLCICVCVCVCVCARVHMVNISECEESRSCMCVPCLFSEFYQFADLH